MQASAYHVRAQISIHNLFSVFFSTSGFSTGISFSSEYSHPDGFTGGKISTNSSFSFTGNYQYTSQHSMEALKRSSEQHASLNILHYNILQEREAGQEMEGSNLPRCCLHTEKQQDLSLVQTHQDGSSPHPSLIPDLEVGTPLQFLQVPSTFLQVRPETGRGGPPNFETILQGVLRSHPTSHERNCFLSSMYWASMYNFIQTKSFRALKSLGQH